MKSFSLIIFSFALYQTIISQQREDEEWENFKKTYNEIYPSQQEEQNRRKIFYENVKVYNEHNSIGINKFSDFLPAEVPISSSSTSSSSKRRKANINKADVPESIDWRDYGVITPIQDQYYCNTCWAFAAVAAIEAHVGIHLNRKNQTLSQGQLMNCVYSEFQCYQHMYTTALEDTFQYIIDSGGIVTAESYPYNLSLPEAECRVTDDMVIGAKISDYVVVPEGDEEELKAVVGVLGPVAVEIRMASSFYVYTGGVFYTEDCQDLTEPYDHAVTIIGYGEEDGVEYWLVRNEWGHFFGNEGYIKMARNKGNLCGIASYATYPIIENEN